MAAKSKSMKIDHERSNGWKRNRQLLIIVSNYSLRRADLHKISIMNIFDFKKRLQTAKE